MPQFVDSDDEMAGFRAVAEDTGSRFQEIVIMDTKQRAVARFAKRGAGEDVPWHGQIKAIVEQGGGSQLLESMYDGLVGGLRKRPSATLIHSTHGAQRLSPADTRAGSENSPIGRITSFEVYY